MNKVFKVIWSEARNAYVVVSEIAKNHGSKSCSTKKLLTMLIATGVMTCASMAPAMAANPAPDDLNVTIGKGAHVSVWNSVSGQTISGDIAVGPNAHAWNGEYTYRNKYARIGSKEYLLDFGQGGVVGAESIFGVPYKYKVADGSKIAGSIAIGKNTVARTGSVMLGDHSYTGKLGDIEINPANAMTYNDGIYSTTLGAGAYNSGSLAAVTGALSIASGSDTKNTGATIYGSMNSIESATSSSDYSGVASSVLGFANRTQNANATLIWGTGNEVTNSIEKVGIDTNWNNVSVADAQQKAIEAMQSSKYAGGSVMAIGGGNKADYAKYSQLTGVQNKVTGTEAKAAQYDFVNGYQNTVKNASDVTVIGKKNEVTADGNKVIGDNQKVSGKDNVIFGSADKVTETTVNNAVVLGHNAKVTGEGGVALGAGSVANRANAVSVGSAGANRQIINVAAGTADTDAVNVSQLKKATANANKGWKLSTEGGAANQVASEATVDFSGKKDAGDHQNITVSNDGNNVKIGLASELHNVTGVVNGDSRVTLGTGVAAITNGQASVVMLNGSTTINGVVGIDNTGKISGVANGEADKDAVNVSQLKDVKAEAEKHSVVTNGANITVTPEKATDGRMQYNVALNNDITLAGDTGDFVSISGSKGTIWASGSVTAGSVVAGSVVMDGATSTVSGLSNTTTAYEGFATTGKAATEEQLKEVATEAGKHTQVKAGTNVGIVPGETEDGTHVYTVNADGTTVSGDSNVVVTAGEKDANNVTNYGVKLNKDLKGIESVSNGSASLKLSSIPFLGATAELTNGKASVKLMDGSTKINGKVEVRQDGTIGGVTAGRSDKDAVNVSQLNNVKAEAGKHTTLSNGKNTTVEAAVKDGQTDYKVNVAGDLTDITSVANGGAKLALNGEAGTAGIINGQGASVYMQGSTTVINGVVGIDNTGKISGVAAGTADTDAVNVSQLKKVSDTANAGWTLSTNGNATGGTNVTPGAFVDFSGDKNVSVSNNGTAVSVKLNKDLQDIESISNGDAKLALNGAAGTAGIINGQGASVYMQGSTTVINQNVSIDKDGKISGVAAGVADTDAVNLGQLKDVKAEAGKHTTLSNGKNTTVEAAVKDGQTDYKVNVAGDLTDISSVANGDAKLALNGAAGTAGIVNGKGASVYMQDGYTVINSKVSFDQDGKISGVAAGVNNDDAVNVSQLKKVEEAAGNANKGWNLSTNGVATEATNVKPGEIVDFSGDKNISVSNDGTKVKVELNKKLKDIETISNGGATLTLGAMGGMVSEFANGQGASVKLFGDTTTINGKVNVYKDGRIAGVADGVNATDAVNVSQLQKAAAASAATVTDGVNTTVTTTTAEDGHVDYKVNLNKNLTGVESISNGGASLTMNGFATELANGQGASVKLFGDTTTINGKVNVYKDGRIAGVADGVNATDAVNVSQLQKAAAASATTVSDGVNTTVTATKAEDGHTDYKVNLNKDLVGIESISNGDAKLTLGGFATELANGQGASVKLFGDTTTINNAVTVYKDGRIAGVANGINDNDAVNVGQLNKVSEIANKGWNLATNGVATEATNVKPGDYVDFSGDKNISVSHDGTKVKVELNKDIDVNSVQTNALNSKYNLSVGTMAENGIMPFFVNSTGAFYAAHNKFSVDKDGNVNANSVQTNALNSKYNLSVGTANENGTVPFFVNSNGAFYAANGKLVVDKDGKLTAPEAEFDKLTAKEGVIGNVVLKDGVFYKHTALRDGELFVGDADGNYSQITTKGAKLGQVTIAADGKISGVAAGDVSSTSTDAINGSQLHQTNVDVAQNKADIAANRADIDKNKADIAANRADIDKNKADIAANRADIDKNKADIAANRADIDKNKADIAANRTDIDKNAAAIAQNKTDIKNLDNRVTDVEELAKKHTTVTAGDNITVTEDTNKDGGKEYKVALDKDIKLDSVTTGQTVMNNDGLKVGKDVSVTATAVTAGKTSISDEGVKVGDKTYISADGLNANDQKVTNVKAGDISETSKDAVNGSQLYKTNQEVANNTNRINQLGSRVNKVGAGAAALAALHPMDFDPDDKLTFSAGYGNYGGENAAAIGAYYRPDEKVMFSVGGTVGNGENMVNAGVSFSLDRTNHVSNSRTAMAREILDLRAEVTELKAMVAKGGLGSIAEDKMKIFPDVAENHWAYEYVGKLAAAGIIEGYPDGNFSGDRMMSRYEFAAMLYRAMQKGAQLDSKIINEFAPEMGRIRVDRISGEDGDRDKIERVRVNAVKGERDHYGNKIAKAEAKAK